MQLKPNFILKKKKIKILKLKSGILEIKWIKWK